VATGVKARPGKFQLAEGGTLLLDEIGEMAPELQAKLLRALQEKEVSPVGSLPVPIDVRVLAATNAEILERMERGHFRRDLFYRLAGFVLRVPPLRDRGADIPLLVERFLRIYSQEIEKPIRGITVGALRALGRYGWPGNVRELEHEIRRLVYLCPPGQAVTSVSISEHILRPASAPRPATPGAERPARDRARRAEPPTVSPPTSEVPSASPAEQLPTLDLSQLEERAVDEAMRRSGGNQVEAAKLLGISRYALRRRL
jgi:transcriptional regulator with PAS, ATPase and Fis domain